MDENQMSKKPELSAFTGYMEYQKQKVKTLTIILQDQKWSTKCSNWMYLPLP